MTDEIPDNVDPKWIARQLLEMRAEVRSMIGVHGRSDDLSEDVSRIRLSEDVSSIRANVRSIHGDLLLLSEILTRVERNMSETHILMRAARVFDCSWDEAEAWLKRPVLDLDQRRPVDLVDDARRCRVGRRLPGADHPSSMTSGPHVKVGQRGLIMR
jgi:hypothetical protein